MLAALTIWPSRTFKFLSMMIIGHFPANLRLFMHVYLSQAKVALMPFWKLRVWVRESLTH